MELDVSEKNNTTAEKTEKELDQKTQNSIDLSAYYDKLRKLLVKRLMKHGKKSTAHNIVYSVFDDTEAAQKKLLQVVEVLKSKHYLRKVVIAGTIRKIPIIAGPEKQIKLVMQIFKIGLDFTIRKLHSTNINSKHGEKKKSDNSFQAAVTSEKKQRNYTKKGTNAITAMKIMIDEALDNKGILIECKKKHAEETEANKAYANFGRIS